MVNQTPQPVYKTTEAAAYLGIVPATLRELVEKGMIGYFKINTEYRFLQSQLDEFIAKRGTEAFENKTKSEE